jgi:hypothetical protein
MARTIPIGSSGIDPALGRANYVTITCPAAGGTTPIDSAKISNNTGIHQGLMIGFKVHALVCANAVNFTLKIKDRDGDVIYTSGNNSSSASVVVITVTMGLAIPIIEQEIITITPAGEPGASGLIVRATLYYDPDADMIAWGFR